MNYYSIALFLHVVGALGFFVVLGLEWTSLRQLRCVVHAISNHMQIVQLPGCRQ